VIGENGGFFFCRSSNAHEVERHFWHAAEERPAKAAQLAKIGKQVMQAVPTAVFAEDQPFRLTSLAFAQPHDRAERDLILDALRSEAADVTVNNLWVLGWIGGYDKLSMARRVLLDHYGLDVDKEPGAVLYIGDSTNDAPMFSFIQNNVGVSTVTNYIDELPHLPRWITNGPGGFGFVEVANAVIASRI
jgi:hypothetical protein